MATALWDTGQIGEAEKVAASIQIELLDKPNQLKVYYLKASLYQKKSLSLEAAKQLLSAGRILSEPELNDSRKTLNRLLDQALLNINDATVLESLYQEFEDSPIVDSLLYKMGSQELAFANIGSSEFHLKTLLRRFPQSPYASQAKEALSSSQFASDVDVQSVGILLPMKGKFSKYGMKSLQAIQFAFDIFNSNSPKTKLQLIVEDTGEEPEQAVKALNRLIFKHHVIAIIGPMVSKGIEQVSQRAQELGVPIVSLARRSGPSLDYVIQAGLTPQLQGSEIARYAVTKLGFKKFAILFPLDKFGMDMSQSFWETAESLGGEIVGAESYNPDETDFRLPIDKLSGLYYTAARQRELDALAKDRETNNITKRTRKTESYYGLKPIVDYEAVFIADESRVAGQILPTFAYRDIEHVQFLGTSSWNSPDFLSRVQSYGEDAHFVDAFFPGSAVPTVRSFSEKYKAMFNQEATSLEALAYDASMILKGILLKSPSIHSRSDVKDHLKQVQDYPGITGRMSYKDGQFIRDLRVVRVKDGKFTQVQ